MRPATEDQEPDERWLLASCDEINSKIDRAFEQVATGKAYGPEEVLKRLSEMRHKH
jgi:hypothetical protein